MLLVVRYNDMCAAAAVLTLFVAARVVAIGNHAQTLSEGWRPCQPHLSIHGHTWEEKEGV